MLSQRPAPTLLLLVAALLAFSFSAARANGDRFCIVTAKPDVAPNGNVPGDWPNNVFTIPGLPAPVFTNSPVGPWTVTADRRLVPYTGVFPHSFLDLGNWVVEPWSKRVVAIPYSGGVAVLDPGSDRFETIGGASRDRVGGYFSLAVLPRRRLTIVIGNGGMPFVVDGRSLRPWLSRERLAQIGLRGILSLRDAPALSATIVVDVDHHVWVLSDADAWQDIGQIDRDTGGFRVFDAPDGRELLFASGRLIGLRRDDGGAQPRFSMTTLAWDDAIGGSRFQVSQLFHRVLTYERPSVFSLQPRWRALKGDSFIDIPGGATGFPGNMRRGSIQDLPTLGRTLIRGQDRLFLYDGEKIVPVQNSNYKQIGRAFDVYDLPEIGRVLVATSRGVFELTGDGRLVPRAMPFPATGLPLPQFADWPGAGVTLASTAAGIFGLDRDLSAVPIPGSDRVDLGWLPVAPGRIPATGDLILNGRRGVFLAVDTNQAGPIPCQDQRESAARIPASDVCTRPVPGIEEAAIGFAIGGMVQAPGDAGVLIDTNRGLFRIAADNTVVPMQPRVGRYTRTLTVLPWSGEAIASGFGTTIVHRDLSLETVQDGDLLGVFPSIEAVLLVTRDAKGAVMLLRHTDGGYREFDTGITGGEGIGMIDAPWFGVPCKPCAARICWVALAN